MLGKIVSGGQTGADRAALDAALDAGFPAGGFCPKGRMAEDGVIDARYPLEEIEGGYSERTLMNVEYADATLIVYDTDLAGGTAQTALHCIQRKKPFKLIDLGLVEADAAASAVGDFLAAHAVRVLNVAGPRQSGSERIYPYVRNLVSLLLKNEQRSSPGTDNPQSG